MRAHEGQPIKYIRFKAQIPTEKLAELIAPGGIVRIDRKSWNIFVEFVSDESAETVEQRVDAWYSVFREEQLKKREEIHKARYRAFAERYCYPERTKEDNLPEP